MRFELTENMPPTVNPSTSVSAGSSPAAPNSHSPRSVPSKLLTSKHGSFRAEQAKSLACVWTRSRRRCFEETAVDRP